MAQLNKNQNYVINPELTAAFLDPKVGHETSNLDLTEFIRSGRVTREVLGAANDYMNKLERKQKALKRHKKTITKGKDGRWRTTVLMPNGRLKDIKKTSREDLEDYLVEFYERVEEHKTVRDIFKEWIQKKEEYHEIKPASVSRYWTDFKRFFPEDDEFCKLEIMDITEADLEDFIKRQIVKHKLTRRTYSGLRILLMGIFKRARKLKLTSISITEFFGYAEIPESIFTRPEYKSDAEEVFSENEERLLLEWLRDRPTLLVNVKPSAFRNYSFSDIL